MRGTKWLILAISNLEILSDNEMLNTVNDEIKNHLDKLIGLKSCFK